MKSGFLSEHHGGGTVYIPRGVRYGTVRRYVLVGMGIRYVGTCFWVRVRYGYGTWVRSV